MSFSSRLLKFSSATKISPPLLDLAKKLAKNGTLNTQVIECLHLASKKYLQKGGRTTPSLQAAFFQIEKNMAPLLIKKPEHVFKPWRRKQVANY